MKGQIIDGYVYSYITRVGNERLVMSSFGISKSKAKQHFEFQNQGKERKDRVEPYKRYAIQIKVIADVDERNSLVQHKPKETEWVSEIPFITAEEWKALNETYRSMESQTEGRKV